MIKSVTLLKSGIDQQQGTVTSYLLFDVRRSRMIKNGEPIQNDMTANHSTTFHIPRYELDRIGINDINAADRIVETSDFSPLNETRYWQPESTTSITVKLLENEVHVDCLRVDPPKTS